MAYSRDDYSFHSPKHFLRTFSYREVLSAVTLILILFAISNILDYADYQVSNPLNAFFYFAFTPFMHILYRLEHKRSNNFVGRVIHDTLYMATFIIISIIIKWYHHSEISFQAIDPFSMLLFSVFLSALIECVVAIFQFLFNLLKWRVL